MALLVAWPHRRRQRPVVDVRGLVNDRVTGDARSAGRDAVTGFASRSNPAARPQPVARGAVNDRVTGDPWSTRSRPPQRPAWLASRDLPADMHAQAAGSVISAPGSLRGTRVPSARRISTCR